MAVARKRTKRAYETYKTHRAPCSFPGVQTKIPTRYRRHTAVLQTAVLPV